MLKKYYRKILFTIRCFIYIRYIEKQENRPSLHNLFKAYISIVSSIAYTSYLLFSLYYFKTYIDIENTAYNNDILFFFL